MESQPKNAEEKELLCDEKKKSEIQHKIISLFPIGTSFSEIESVVKELHNSIKRVLVHRPEGKVYRWPNIYSSQDQT